VIATNRAITWEQYLLKDNLWTLDQSVAQQTRIMTAQSVLQQNGNGLIF